jgi:hypothetical protein
MKTIFHSAALFLALSACDGSKDNPAGSAPPAAGTPPVTGGQVCTQEAKICADGSLAERVEGTCEQKCKGE